MNKSQLRPNRSNLRVGRIVYQVVNGYSTGAEIRRLEVLTKPMGLKGLKRKFSHLDEDGQLDRELRLGRPRLGDWLFLRWTREWDFWHNDETDPTPYHGVPLDPPIVAAVAASVLLDPGLKGRDKTFFTHAAAWRYYRFLLTDPTCCAERAARANSKLKHFYWGKKDPVVEHKSNILFDDVTQSRQSAVL